MTLRIIGPGSGLGSALALLLALGGCASAPVAPPEAAASPLLGQTAQAFAVADAIAEAALPQAVAAFDARLKSNLAALPPSPAYRLVSGGGQPARLILDADRAFEVGNAQLKPELLLPLADTVDASRVAGAWVIHVIGIAGTADEAGLAERRAASVLAYLGSQGVSGGRLRSETRLGAAHSLELQVVPIVQGREARAWMSPEPVTARR